MCCYVILLLFFIKFCYVILLLFLKLGCCVRVFWFSWFFIAFTKVWKLIILLWVDLVIFFRLIIIAVVFGDKKRLSVAALHYVLICHLIISGDLGPSRDVGLERSNSINCIHILVHIHCFRFISLLHDFDMTLSVLNCHWLNPWADSVIWIGLALASRHALRGFLLSLHMQLEFGVIWNFYRADWLVIHNFIAFLSSPSVLVVSHLKLFSIASLGLSLRQLLKVVYDTFRLRIDVLNLTFIPKWFEIIWT